MIESTRRALARAEVERAEQRAVQAAADLENALARLAGTEDEPDEPKKHSIIKFQVQYANSTTTYTYVAYRAPTGKWYRTGSDEVMTWDEMVALMYRDVTAKQFGIGFYLYAGITGTWVGRSRS
jgi:hypothetical protein